MCKPLLKQAVRVILCEGLCAGKGIYARRLEAQTIKDGFRKYRFHAIPHFSAGMTYFLKPAKVKQYSKNIVILRHESQRQKNTNRLV